MPAGLEHLPLRTAPITAGEAADLRRFVALVPDPRGLRGRRYPAPALLCAAAAAVLTGARSLVAIGEWIADAPQSVLKTLGFPPDPLTGIRPAPHAATVRRLLQRLDGDALDAAIGAYLQARTPPPPPSGTSAWPMPRAIAVDGKTVRGSRTTTATAIQLLAAMDHRGTVLAQRQIAAKSNEIPSFQPLLEAIDLDNTVLTATHCTPSTSTVPTSADAAPTTWPSSRRTIRDCMRRSGSCPGPTSPSTTAPGTPLTTATRSAGSRSLRSAAWTIPAPARPSRSCAGEGS
ncbi:transposase family protein [Streptomyces sp. NPDC005336]|uniref:transposase family protein n=1 Tax=Streptomyces sp. NPDC005336 TaxID=3157035 RepID=UPI0033ADC5FA